MDDSMINSKYGSYKDSFLEVLQKLAGYLVFKDKFELSLACKAMFNIINYKSEAQAENEIKAIDAKDNDPKELVMNIFYTVAEYLNIGDILKASMTCRILRSVLCPNIFKKFKIFVNDYEDYTDLGKVYTNSSFSQMTTIDYLGSKIRFIRYVQFKMDFNNYYNFKFFDKLSNLTILKFINCAMTDVVLLNILKNLKFLKEIWIKQCKVDYNGCELLFDLPKTLKSLCVQGRKHPLPYNVLQVFNTHTNLENVYTQCHTMLYPFLDTYPSLNYIRMNDCKDITLDNFKIILSNNQQIKKISISANLLNCELINEILKLSNLKILKIFKPSQSISINNNVISNSLEQLIIESYVPQSFTAQLILICPNLRQIYINFELNREIYLSIKTLIYLKSISFKHINIDRLYELAKEMSINTFNWTKNPSFLEKSQILSRLKQFRYNTVYINNLFCLKIK